jgi:uncharacterized protein YvpB
MKIPGWASVFFLFGLCVAARGCHASGGTVRPPETIPAAEAEPSVRSPSRSPSGTGIPAFDGTPTACLPDPRYAADGSLLPTPTLPSKADIQNIRGRGQALPLDCESRSAVDWANYFGVTIDELEFFNKIPPSDNPDRGFVGSVYGSWGNIPPNAYGVHAGLAAYAYRGLSWEQLRTELAAGRPVIVWVTGHVWRSTPVTMTVTSGANVLVARLEHTVILIGYTEKTAAVLDGASKYSVSIEAFTASWSVLGNMGIVGRILPARPDCAGRAVELVP